MEKRVTFYLEEELHKELKHEAIRRGVSLKDLMAELIREWFAANLPPPEPATNGPLPDHSQKF